jgi:hypothetical protein
MTENNTCDSCDCACSRESEGIPITDSMGREIWWEDAGRPEGK